jgi:hypothetical protein
VEKFSNTDLEQRNKSQKQKPHFNSTLDSGETTMIMQSQTEMNKLLIGVPWAMKY